MLPTRIFITSALLTLVSATFAERVDIPLAAIHTQIPPGAPIELSVVPNLITSFTTPTGLSASGSAQSFLYKNDVTPPHTVFSFDAGAVPAGRYFVGYRELNPDSTPRSNFRVLHAQGEPTAVFFGSASKEPLQIGTLRVTPTDSLLIATFGADAGAVPSLKVSAAEPRVPFFSWSPSAPPAQGVTGATLDDVLSALNADPSLTYALLRQTDKASGNRYTLVLRLPAAASAGNLAFTLEDTFTKKILKDGAIGSMQLPSVQDWIGAYYQRLKGSAPSAPGSLVGLTLLAHQGVAHADMEPATFEFMKESAPYSDYTQMAAAFTQALSGGGTLAHLFTAAKALNSNPLQDPIELKLKQPKDNVVFIDGYSALALDSLYAPLSISAWRTRPTDASLALSLRYSKNIALYERDLSQGKYVFKPLLAEDPATPPVPVDPKFNGTSLILPLTPARLSALLKSRLYVKGNSPAMHLPEEPFYLSLKVVRCPAGVTEGQAEDITLEPIPSAGRVFSGPEKSAFQIWAYDQAGKEIKNAKYGHYLVRGQKRKLAYANAYKLGMGIELNVLGRDADSVEVEKNFSVEGEGNLEMKTRTVKSRGAMGTGLGGLLFQAVDFSEVNGDTLVERVFERDGALFGLGLVVPTVAGPVDNWPATVERDAVAPVALFHSPEVSMPLELQSSGKLEVWLDKDVQVYTNLFTQTSATRLFPGESTIEASRIFASNKSGYAFDLADAALREKILGASGLFSKVRAIVAGSQAPKSFRIVYKPEGEPGDYLQEELTTTFSLKNCVAKIAGDFVNIDTNKVINRNDFEFIPKKVEHWTTDYSAEVYEEHKNLAGAKNYKLNMDLVPLKVVKSAEAGKYEIGLKNATGSGLSFKFATLNRLLNRKWIFEEEVTEKGDNPMTSKYYTSVNEIGKDEYFRLDFASDTLGLLVAGRDPSQGVLKVLIGNDGHFAEVDTVRLAFHDIENEIAVYTSRYAMNEGDADSLAKAEGIDNYHWEDGKLLSDPRYGKTNYNVFSLRSIKRFGGKNFASISQFDTAQKMMVFIHGFNSKEVMDETYATGKTFLKKFRLQGYTGSFLSYHWYGDFNPGGKNGGVKATLADAGLFLVDQLNAFKSSSPLLELLSDTLGDFSNKQLVVHSLGNQVVMDMLRLNAETPEFEDIGVTKYNILEAALPQAMIWPKSLGENLRQNGNWVGIANMVGATYSGRIQLNNFMRDDDRVVGIIFRANQYLKTQIGQYLFNAAMRSNFEGPVPADYRVSCPVTSGTDRLPIHLAVCYASEPLLSRTFPQNGVPDGAWTGANNIDVQGKYKANSWKCGNAHSYLNVDQAYKTRFIVDEILK